MKKSIEFTHESLKDFFIDIKKNDPEITEEEALNCLLKVYVEDKKIPLTPAQYKHMLIQLKQLVS